MPNICCFSARIRGKAGNVKKLTEWLKADYQYVGDFDKETGSYKEIETPLCYFEKEGKKIDTEHHIGGRVFSFDLDDESLLENAKDNDVILVEAYGDCAWSVYCCMLEGEYSYYDLIKKEHANSKSIPITKACKELNLEFEIFSEEPGCCFSEHYLINNRGEIIVQETVDFYDTCIDDYQTFEELEKEFKKEGWTVPFGKEQFDSTKAVGGSYVTTCEFLDNGDCWPFILD